MHTKLRSVRPTTLAAVSAGGFIIASGFVHLREWLQIYRDVPSAVPGAAVVRIGFPANVAASSLLALVLVVAALRAPRWLALVAGSAAVFEAMSLASLILSRTSNVLGWSEKGWSPGAAQTRALEIGALLSLAALGAVLRVRSSRASGRARRVDRVGAGAKGVLAP